MEESLQYFTEPEELLEWMREHEEFKVMNKNDAQLLLNYMEGHDYLIGTDEEKNLVRADVSLEEIEIEPCEIDDVIDFVCEWNDELIRDTTQELSKMPDGKEKEVLEIKLASLKQDEIKLDKMFSQTKYPAQIEALATELANAFIERLGIDESVRELTDTIHKEPDRGGGR